MTTPVMNRKADFVSLMGLVERDPESMWSGRCQWSVALPATTNKNCDHDHFFLNF